MKKKGVRIYFYQNTKLSITGGWHVLIKFTGKRWIAIGRYRSQETAEAVGDFAKLVLPEYAAATDEKGFRLKIKEWAVSREYSPQGILTRFLNTERSLVPPKPKRVLSADGTKIVYEHKLIWENHYGVKLKADDLIIFRDGNPRNTDISNLELVHRKDKYKYRGLSEYPVELRPAVKALVNLNSAIKQRQNDLNGRKNKRWSSDEDNVLKQIFNRHTDQELSEIMSRSVESVKTRIYDLDLRENVFTLNKDRFSADETEILIELYPNTANNVIAEKMGRSIRSIVNKAKWLKLKKSGAYRAQTREICRRAGRINIGK